MIIRAFDIEIRKENVLFLVDCKKDSPIYEEVEEELCELLEEAYEKIEPVALLAFGPLSERLYEGAGEAQALFCIASVGGEISKWATSFFESGDYLKGMLADAIADDVLFQMDDTIGATVKQLCKDKKMGVKKRLEAPHDISMQVQRTAWEITNAKANAGIDIMESLMYHPVKTTCNVYLLDECEGRYALDHDCSSCPNISCKLRSVPAYLIPFDEAKKDKNLLERLRESGVYISAVCGGRAVCGTCAVRFKKGAPKPSREDEAYFTEAELEKGYRLSCTAYIEEECEVELLNAAEQGFVIEQGEPQETKAGVSAKDGDCDIIIDIGTTTVVLQLVHMQSKNVLDSYAVRNRQRAYGADVISRIVAAGDGEADSLQTCIVQDLAEGIASLQETHQVSVRHIVIAANTTMVHLLMGYPCEQLGVWPFTPYYIKKSSFPSDKLFAGMGLQAAVSIFPGISTFVGGDIVAGLLAVRMEQKEEVCVFIDLGTNGELAIGNKDKIMVSSTAAGPAFEGGTIAHGVGSVTGAIDRVKIENGKTNIHTIGDAPPIGICGTGVLSLLYELLRNEIVDETGRLAEPYLETGYPVAEMRSGERILFTQKDVREVQLAKAAVRAGMETLLYHYGTDYGMINTLYIAGGFGTKLEIEKAAGIGLLPAVCVQKTKAIGNSCIKGLHRYVTNEVADEAVEQLILVSEEVSLANDAFFNASFVEEMGF